MAKDLNRSIKIYLDHSDVMKKAKDVEKKMADLRQSLADLDAQGKKGTAEYARQEKALNQMAASYGRYQEQLRNTERILRNLSGATQAELEAVRKQLRRELREATRGTEEYRARLQALTAVERELAIVERERTSSMGRNATMWSRMADGFNKYFGIVTSIIAGITGLSLTFRKLAENVAKMDDVYADVMKTTGLTRDEVVDLNEEFKKMDTRTAREELNLLARDAGKLGLSSKKDLLDFAEAGNQIRVALGEDLGDDAIKNIGKMTDVFALSTKELEQMDLKGKMLAVGSAINELGQSSTASEAYMVNFTQRLGGVASQAGISIQNILGYASALDQSGQAVEMSATALQKFIMNLMGDPVKFAKIAGIEVSKFNNLLKTDTNEAIKLVLSSLSEKGGFQALIPIFKDMGLDGARAVGVLSALATNIDKVNTAQDIANKAFSEGVSITKEYDVKNNNMQATLDKQRKLFNDAALELGERLNPVLLKSTKLTTYFIKALPTLIDWFEKYGRILLYVASVGLVYVAGAKLQVLWNTRLAVALSLSNIQLKLKAAWLLGAKVAVLAYNVVVALMTGNVTRAAAAWKMLNQAIKSNPWGLAAALVTAFAGALYLLYKRSTEVTQLQKSQEKINQKVNEQYDTQKSKIDILVDTLNNEALSLEKRRIALNELKRIVPGYHADLTNEGVLINNNTSAIEEYLVQLEKQIRLKAAQEELEELYRAKRKQEKTVVEKQSRADSAKRASETVIIGQPAYAKDASGIMAAQSQMFANTAKEELKQTEKAITVIRDEIQQGMKDIVKIDGVIGGHNDNGSGGGGYTPDNGKNKLVEKQKEELTLALEAIETTHQKKLFEIKQKYHDGEIESEYDFNNQTFAQEQAYYLVREQSLTEFLKKVTDKELRSDINKQIAEIQNRRIDQELKYKAALEKIILDANPIAKEEKEYEERLRAHGLFGLEKEKMTEQQLEAFELLEKQHSDNMVRIRKDLASKLKAAANESFEEDFQSRKEQLEQELADQEQQVSLRVGIGALSDAEAFEAERALQQKRIALIQEEIAARKKAGLDVALLMRKQRSEELALTNLYVQEYKRRTQQYNQYGQDLGAALGNVLIGEENALRGFGSIVLDILFDTLGAIINAKIAEATAVAIAEQAKAAAIAAASPDSVMSFGATAVARTAAIGAIIMGALAAAKTVLKGLLMKKPNTDNLGGGSTPKGSGERVYNQRADGKYDVIGADDGKLYQNVPFTGVATTGVVATPTLMGEQGSELVVSHPDFMALQKHMNYPLIVQAIKDVQNGHVPQRASGKYDVVETTQTQEVPSIGMSPELIQALADAIHAFNAKELDFNYYKFEKKKNLVDTARSRATKR